MVTSLIRVQLVQLPTTNYQLPTTTTTNNNNSGSSSNNNTSNSCSCSFVSTWFAPRLESSWLFCCHFFQTRIS